MQLSDSSISPPVPPVESDEDSHPRLAKLIRDLRPEKPLPTAIIHPCDHDSLLGALAAAKDGSIEPILIGPREKIAAAAEKAEVSIEAYEQIETPHSHASAAEAVALAHKGAVGALMKGSLHSDEVLHEVAKRDGGLRTDRRISHTFVMDVPKHPRLLAITDAAVNIAPSLEDKADIVQNAIDLMRAIGVEEPKVAILAAVEVVTSKMSSTLDAAALCKMAERGQITGGLLDGPLAFDNAISAEAARTKHIVSAVAGQPDILVVPDIDAGNMLAKQLTFLSGADSAGVVLGARVPVMLTSRADSVLARRASAAVAGALARAKGKSL